MTKQFLLSIVSILITNRFFRFAKHSQHLFVAVFLFAAFSDASARKFNAPPCAAPTNLIVSGITNTAATVSWTSGGPTDFEYAILQSSTPPASGTAITGTTAPVSGLLASNNYYLHVRAKCGATYSAWVTSEPFTTLDPPASLVTWNPSGLSNFGPNPFSPTYVDSRVIVGGITRGAGVSATGSAAPNGWGGHDWMGSATQDVKFAVAPKNGYKLSLNSLQLSYRVSATGPTSGALSYSLDNGNTYTAITTFTFAVNTSGYTLPLVDLSGIVALQNIDPSTAVLFRLFPTGSIDNAGTWYVYKSGLTVNGFLTSTISTPSVTVSGASPGCFTAAWTPVGGASNYVVSVSTPAFSLAKDSTSLIGYDFEPSLKSNLGLNANYPSGNMNIPMVSAGGTSTVVLDVGTPNSARASNWNSGSGTKYWETYFTTTGYYSIRVSSTQRSSSTGPKDFKLQYKVGSSGTYADVTSGSVILADDYTTGVLKNLSLPAACNNQSLVYLRWIMTSNTPVIGAAVASAGTSNIADINIYGFLGSNITYVTGYGKDTVANTPTSLQVTGLASNTIYYVNVRSIVGGVTSNASTTVSITTATSSTADYRSRQSGIWSSASTWEYDQGCGQTWVTATTPPGVDNNIIIQNNHSITLDANTTVNAGKTLTIEPAGVLALNDKSFTLNGTLSGSGSFLGSAASSLVFNGSGPSTLNLLQAVQGASNILANLTVNSGNVTLGNKLHLYKLLDVTGGTLNLAGQSLVLKSTPIETVRVAEIKGTLIGATNVTVERYLSNLGTRRWRLLTSPVSGTNINASWQEGGTWSGGTAETSTGYGTLITGNQQGTSGNANGNGFDFWSATANTLASVRYYQGAITNTAASWAPLSKTTVAGFDANQAYLLFVRGDRSISSGTGVTATILRATGTLHQGPASATVVGSNAQSHTLIGNPYPSPLDFYALYSDPSNSGKIKNQFWLFAANLGAFGAYKLVIEDGTNTGKYEALPEPFTPTTGFGSTDTRLIHSGSGFFVEPLSAVNKSITILESHKTGNTPSQNVFREADEGVILHKLYINLAETGPAFGDTLLLDGALVRFGAMDKIGKNIRKAVNTGENLSFWKEGSDLIVLAGSFPKAGDSLPLHLWNLNAQRAYLFQTKGLNLSELNLQAYLADKYLGTETALYGTGAVSTIEFNVTNEAASKDPYRFSIVFKSAQALPLTIPVLRAYLNSNGSVQVEWKTENEDGVKTYEVEKATDGISFGELSSVKAKGGATQAYACTDWQPSPVNYYRIKIICTNGNEKYSDVVRLVCNDKNQDFVIYPNPSDGRSVGLQLMNKPGGLYKLTFYNASGQMVLQQSLVHAGGNAAFSITPHKNLSAGVYTLKLSNINGKSKTKNLQVVH